MWYILAKGSLISCQGPKEDGEDQKGWKKVAPWDYEGFMIVSK